VEFGFFRRKIFRFNEMATANRAAAAIQKIPQAGKGLSNRIVSYLIGYAFQALDFSLRTGAKSRLRGLYAKLW
jgi:hypothetical protein